MDGALPVDGQAATWTDRKLTPRGVQIACE
jgi:hypothetical protein